MAKRGLRGAGAAVAVALLLASCGSSDAQYVKNGKAGIFVEVPKAWGVFTLRAGHPMELGAKRVTNGSEAVGEGQTPWLVGFDGAKEPTRANFEATEEPSDPIGSVQVLPVRAEANLPRTLGGLRSIFTDDGSDPLAAPASGFEIKDYAELEFPSGHWGIRMTFQRTDGSATHMVEAIAAFDRTVERVYIVEIQCTDTCFDKHHDEIEQILDSVTLEQR